MYNAIVRAKVRATFDRINAGDYMTMIDSLAPGFEYHFHGEHALGGHRSTKESMIRWWERVFRVLPGAQFTIHDILVNGPPWRTRIAVRARIAGDLPGGERYENTVFQFMTLTWGRVARVETIEDLQVLERALQAVAATGEQEATAQPIVG